MKSHLLGKKRPKRKREFTQDQPVHPTDVKRVKKLLGVR
jgi:ribosomal protein L35